MFYPSSFVFTLEYLGVFNSTIYVQYIIKVKFQRNDVKYHFQTAKDKSTTTSNLQHEYCFIDNDTIDAL